MAKKIDPINKKNYSAVSTMLTVSDLKAAVKFYEKAFGFKKRMIMKGPDGKPTHAEMQFRETTMMLGAENPAMGARSAKSIGGTPATLYLLTEDVDKVFAKAVKLGATPTMPVTDMYWGDRCGLVSDADGNSWMIATHVADPTPEEMKKAQKAMAKAKAAEAKAAEA